MNARIVIASIALVAGAAQAGSFEDTAHVLGVQEKYDNSMQRRVVCVQGVPAQSSGPGAGTVVGAVAGGLLGAQVGKGNGRVAAAAVGAATGAVVGTQMGGSRAGNGSRCQEVSDGGGRVVGYTVTYEYAGRTFTEFAARPPIGDTMRVRVSLFPSGQ